MGRPISRQQLLELQKETRSETDMTYTHKGTVFKIGEIIFNMRIFSIEVT